MNNCLVQENADPNYIVFAYYADITTKDCHFLDNKGTAIYAYESRIVTSGVVLFSNNTDYFGGALHHTSSPLALSENATVNFYNNIALNVGGAIFINNPLFYLASVPNTRMKCFYEVPWNGTGYPASLVFTNNTAKGGGHHIYGVSGKSHCVISDNTHHVSKEVLDSVFAFNPPLNSSWSEISSAPSRVCLCTLNGQPQCANLSMIMVAYTIHLQLHTIVLLYQIQLTMCTNSLIIQES